MASDMTTNHGITGNIKATNLVVNGKRIEQPRTEAQQLAAIRDAADTLAETLRSRINNQPA